MTQGFYNNVIPQSHITSNNDSTFQALNTKIDSLNTKIGKIQNSQLKNEIETAKSYFERANRIIDWSAMIFTALAVLLVVAGGVGLNEFSKIRQTEQSMRKILAEINNELEEIKKHRVEIVSETKKFMELTYYLNAGIQAYYSGDIIKARELLYKVLDFQPNHTRAYYYIGHSLRLENNYRDAITIFEKMLDIDPTNTKAYYGIGMCYREFDKEKAIEFFKKSLDLDPKHDSALNRLGTLYRDLDRIEEAFKCYLKARSIRIYSVTSFNIALVYYIKNDFENFKKYFDEVKYLSYQQIEKAHSPHWAYYHLAVIEGLNNNLSESKKLFKKAFSHNNSVGVRNEMKIDLHFLLKHIKDNRKIKTMITSIDQGA